MIQLQKQQHWMNLQIDPLGDPLTTRPMQPGWDICIELYPSWQFGCVDNAVHQFGNGLVQTWTLTWSDGPEAVLVLLKRHGSWRITLVSLPRKIIFHIQFDLNWPTWQTKRSKLAAKDFKTSKSHQDPWNRYLMMGFGSAHIPWNPISRLEQQWSFKALGGDIVLQSATTLSNICRGEHAVSVAAIEM